MKRISRRQFAKLAGAAAVTVPVAAATLTPPVGALLVYPEQSERAAPQAQQPPASPPPAEPRVKLTPDQETRVKQSIERRDRQLASFRARVLPYELEPAFVFQVKSK